NRMVAVTTLSTIAFTVNEVVDQFADVMTSSFGLPGGVVVPGDRDFPQRQRFPLKIEVSIESNHEFRDNHLIIDSLFEANEVKEVMVEFNKDFIQRVVSKMDWTVLSTTAAQFGVDLPSDLPQSQANDDLLKKIHHALLEIEVMSGHLVCPETGRKFPIAEGIPNMLCNEDEV
ncbi:unnamed protein product, partial [Medioppia subpectinata]